MKNLILNRSQRFFDVMIWIVDLGLVAGILLLCWRETRSLGGIIIVCGAILGWQLIALAGTAKFHREYKLPVSWQDLLRPW